MEREREETNWYILGKEVPKLEVIFFAQVFILYIIIITSIVNLSVNGEKALWVSLLSSSLGILLPTPTTGERKRNIVGSDCVDGIVKKVRDVSNHS